MKRKIKGLLIGIISILIIGLLVCCLYSPFQSGGKNIQNLVIAALRETIIIDFHQRNNAEIKSIALPLNRKIKKIEIISENGPEIIEFKDSIEEYLAKQLVDQYMLAQMHPINPDNFNAIFSKELTKKGITAPTGIIYRHKGKTIYSNNDSLSSQNAIVSPPIAIDIKKSASVQAWTKCDRFTLLSHSNKEAFWTIVIFFAVSALVLSYKGKKKAEPKTESSVVEELDRGIRIEEAKQKVYIDGNECKFTKTGFLLIHQFMNEPNYFVPRDKIIEMIWPEDSTTDRTLLNNRLDGHIKRLREDLKEYPLYEIKTEKNSGYQLIIHTHTN